MSPTQDDASHDELPFSEINNQELHMVLETTKSICIEKLENNGFFEFIKQFLNSNRGTKEFQNVCKYYSIDEFNSSHKGLNRKFSVFHMNVRRIAANKGELLALLLMLDCSFDTIILTEIGDDGGTYLNDNFLTDYSVFVNAPTNNKYGGTAILAKEGIGDINTRDDLRLHSECNCENLKVEDQWIEINTEHKQFIIGGIYRHPNGNVTHYVEQLDNILNKLPRNATTIIAGDINIDLLKYEQPNTFEYFTTLASHNFYPYISTPTRITDYKASLIDHIFVKFSDKDLNQEVSAGNILTDITDHLPNFLLIGDKKPIQSRNSRPLIRIYSENNIRNFKDELEVQNWEEIHITQDTDSCYQDFYTKIYHIYERNFPAKRLSRKRAKDKKWITSELKTSIKLKDKLFAKQRNKKTPENIAEYKRYRNSLNMRLKQAEISYYKEKLSDRRNSVTTFWKTFGQTLNPRKKKENTRIQKLVMDNDEITSDQLMADCMNDYFCSVGENIDKQLPKGRNHFRQYMSNKIQQTFFLSATSEQDVLRELKALNPKKAGGPDNLTPRLLKEVAHELYKPLTALFNKSIEEAKFPGGWKFAKVIALFKKGSRFLPENYRPISLLNCFGKIFERIIYNQMVRFINKHNILYIRQFGFRENFSTTLALIDLIDKIQFALDRNEYVIGIFLDIKKAFDSINHDILLQKLEHYGFRGHFQLFMRSYLSNREQYTLINGCNSEKCSIKYGVPQGSILGPLLFLLFINDLQNATDDAESRLFADDTSAILTDKNLDRLIHRAQSSMLEIQNWFIANRLALSIGKSNFMLFHKKQAHVNIPDELHIGTESIPRVKKTKYVGMMIDENLTWEHHISEICNSLVKYFGVFYNIRNFINIQLARTIYYACIYSRIQYGIEIYGSASKTQLSRLQTMQNKLLKVLTKQNRLYSTDALHRDLKILKVEHIYQQSVLRFVHNCVIESPIEVFENYFTSRDHVHGHNTRGSHNLVTHRARSQMGQKTTHYTGAKLWNNLGQEIINAPSKYSFKKRIFKHYIAQYAE